MNRKKFITLWIAAMLLASCSADWEPDTQPCGQQPIRLTANAGEAPALPAEGLTSPGQTRAASTDDLQNTAFAAGEDVAVYLVDCDNAVGGDLQSVGGDLQSPTYTATPYRYRASAAVSGQNALTYYSDATTPSMLYFPADEASDVSVYAFYPYSRFASVANRETTNLDVTVNADQSTADGYRASDVMIATPVTDHSRYPKNDNTVNLQFRHVMAKLIIRLKQGVHAGSSSPITAAELAGSTITIGSVTTEATLNMTTGAVTTGSDMTTVTVASNVGLAFYYDNSDAAISTTEYAIVLPAQTFSSTNTLTLTTNYGETITGSLPDMTLAAASSNVLTLTVNDSGIEATRTDYGNGGGQSWGTVQRKLVSEITSTSTLYKGWFIARDGYAYQTREDAASHNATVVACITNIGSTGSYSSFIAIATEDISTGSNNYNNYNGMVGGWTSSHSVSNGGGSWRIPTVDDWKYIFAGVGGQSYTSGGVSFGSDYSPGVRGKLNVWLGYAADATDNPGAIQALSGASNYWTSTGTGSSENWVYNFYSSKWYWDDRGSGAERNRMRLVYVK